MFFARPVTIPSSNFTLEMSPAARGSKSVSELNCDERLGRASPPTRDNRLSRMEVRMKVLRKTAHRPLTICPRIVIPGAIGLVVSAVFAASPGDAGKSNHTLDCISSAARQSSGSNTQIPERSVQKEQGLNGRQDRNAGISHEEMGCGEEAIVFQSANKGVYRNLQVDAAPLGTEIEPLRNPESEQSDGWTIKFVPTFPRASSASMPAVRTQTTAVPSCMQRVTITSNPCGATIYIDSIQAGRTPISFPVPPGRYTLTLLAPGHQMYAQRILVSDGPLEIKANLVPDR